MGFFLPSALPSKARGGGVGGFPGSTKGPAPRLPVSAFPPPPGIRASVPSLTELHPALLQRRRGPVVPAFELCLWPGLPGTDAKWVPVGVRWGSLWDQNSGLTDQPEMRQSQTSWAPSPYSFGSQIDKRSVISSERARPGPKSHRSAARDRRSRGRLGGLRGCGRGLGAISWVSSPT